MPAPEHAAPVRPERVLGLETLAAPPRCRDDVDATGSRKRSAPENPARGHAICGPLPNPADTAADLHHRISTDRKINLVVGLGRGEPEDGLRLQVFFQSVVATLPSVTALLVAAERGARIGRPLIDPELAGSQP